jgi:hypothetical protein
MTTVNPIVWMPWPDFEPSDMGDLDRVLDERNESGHGRDEEEEPASSDE